MYEVSIALLQLPDNRVVFQRRDDDAPSSAGKLGFFGGQIEKGESPAEAIRRELTEETSLDVPALDFKYQESFKTVVDTINGQETRKYHLYKVSVQDNTFKVYEGVRSETYNVHEALERDDLTRSVARVLKQL